MGQIIEEAPGAVFVVMRNEGQVGQIIEEAPGAVFVVMRDVMGGGAYRGVRNAGVEGQWELARVERRHGPGRGCNRRRSAFQVWPLVM